MVFVVYVLHLITVTVVKLILPHPCHSNCECLFVLSSHVLSRLINQLVQISLTYTCLFFLFLLSKYMRMISRKHFFNGLTDRCSTSARMSMFY